MPKMMDLLRQREEEILKAILHLREETKEFTDPKLVIIGGYALRAFIKFSRYTRDCDFILKKRDGWHLDDLSKVLPNGYSVEAIEKQKGYGYMRCLRALLHGKAKIRVAMDFMEGMVVGRKEKDKVLIDNRLIEDSSFAVIPIAGQSVRVLVPEYRDYFILKVISARASDIRDIASLILERGIPDDLKGRVRDIIPDSKVFDAKYYSRTYRLCWRE